MSDFAVADKSFDGGTDDLGGDGKAHARKTIRVRDQESIDANDFAAHVDQRTSGVAGVDGGIGLNEASGRAAILRERIRTVESADNAAGYGEAESEGVAEGKHGLAGAQSGGVAPGSVGKIASVDLDDGEVGKRIGTDKFGVHDAAILQGNVDVDCAIDDVIVGDDVAIGRDENTAADSMLDLRLRLHRMIKEWSEHWRHAFGQVRHLAVCHFGFAVRGDCNVHHCGGNAGGQRFHCLVERKQCADAVVIERRRGG